MKKPNLSNDQKKQLVVKLCWWILEQKLMYYNVEYGKCVSDDTYDAQEQIYKDCCEDLGLEPTASNHVGFPWDTPSGRLVVSKLSRKLPNNVTPLSSVISEPHQVEAVRTRSRTRKRTVEPEAPRVRTRSRDNVEEITRVRTRPRKRSP